MLLYIIFYICYVLYCCILYYTFKYFKYDILLYIILNISLQDETGLIHLWRRGPVGPVGKYFPIMTRQ